MRPELLWTVANLGQLILALAQRAGLDPRLVEAPRDAPNALPDSAELRGWIARTTAWFGIEAELIAVQGNGLEERLQRSAPALLPVSLNSYVALLAIRGRHAKILAPDGSTQIVSSEALRAAISHEKEALHAKEVDALLDRCSLKAAARAKARTALLRESLQSDHFLIWQLRSPPGSSFVRQLRANGLLTRLSLLISSHAAEYLLWLAAWWVIGSTALTGRLDSGWLFAWVLLLFTAIPFRILTTWNQGVLAVGSGGLLRQRLLAGAMKLGPERIGQEGAGQLLGRVLEAETLESLALSGGLTAGLAVFEVLVAAIVLSLGAGGVLHLLLFLLWLALSSFLAWRYARERLRWTSLRLAMTHDIVERMTGNRTRITQQMPSEWHGEEDLALEAYTLASRKLDRANIFMTGIVPRGWLFVGLAALSPAFLAPHPSPVALGTAVGGLILGWQSLRKLTAGTAQLAGAVVAWQQVAPIFQAAAEQNTATLAAATVSAGTVIEVSDLTYRLPNREEPILCGIDLKISSGDSILLEGASGGGKSTLGAILSGLREPSSGVLLASGLDRRTLGTRVWQQRIACAPQYHQNHVFSGSFAFNLLLGRHWPAASKDLEEAAEVCRELGLTPLLDRMPGGLYQMVGETGWQLSQGERSRLYMARALLQGADLVVLDESFAALDPENLQLAVDCVLKRAKTLLVVAHP